MKELLTIAKRSAVESDGFINGMVKGFVVCAAVIVAFTFMTGYSV